MKKVVLAFDDFSVVNNRLDLLLKLREHFLNFKVSLFTVPIDEKRDWGPYLIREESLKKIKENLDWIQIIPHGVLHDGREMKTYDMASFLQDGFPAIKDAFDKDGLPFEGGFCAPHHAWSDGVVEGLNRLKWWGLIKPGSDMKRPKRFYIYDYTIDQPFWNDEREVLKLHGHIYGTKNDLGLCFDNLLKLPYDIEFDFVSNHVESN